MNWFFECFTTPYLELNALQSLVVGISFALIGIFGSKIVIYFFFKDKDTPQ